MPIATTPYSPVRRIPGPGQTYQIGGQTYFNGRPWPPPDMGTGEPIVPPVGPTTPSLPGAFGPGVTEWPSGPGAGAGPTQPGAPGGPGGPGDPHNPITIRHGGIDYSGILNRYAADWNARLNAGLAANEAQRLSKARATINRLGLRDAGAAAGLLSKYGLTAADLQSAQDNPWSDLKAIQFQADRARGQGIAGQAARGMFRSGGTAVRLQDIENSRARAEAQSSQEALSSLDQDVFQNAQWENQQRDQITGQMQGLQTQLAGIYQPYNQQADWDTEHNAYRAGNTLYDQWGNVVGTV